MAFARGRMAWSYIRTELDNIVPIAYLLTKWSTQLAHSPWLTAISWSIDSCQNKASADQYHITILQAQVQNSSRSLCFLSWPLTMLWTFIGLHWVIPEKIHIPPTDGILEILAGGGVKDSGNPGRRGGWPEKKLAQGSLLTTTSVKKYLWRT